MKQFSTNRRGFTLLEILIATGIFMTIIVVAIAIFATTLSTSSVGEQLRLNSESARFAFEAISRQIRLAHGLVYTDTSGKQQMIIPPFDIAPSSTDNSLKIDVYNVVKQPGVAASSTTQNQSLYSVTRYEYSYDASVNPATFTVIEQKSTDTTMSIDDLKGLTKDKSYDEIFDTINDVNNSNMWSKALNTSPDMKVNIMPKGVQAVQFTALHFQNYMLACQVSDGCVHKSLPIDSLTSQPFVELELTVQNQQIFNTSTHEAGQQAQATLRTMIVPRDYISPYDVVQPGVQGVAN